MMKLFKNPLWLIAALGAAILVIGGLGVGVVYFVVFPSSAPKPLALSTATPTATSTQSASASASASGATSPGAGTWTIASGSVAGYRVREELAFIGAPSDAVGRTSSITGSFTLTQSATGGAVAAASFAVDVGSLTSDRSMRDQRIHSIGLESDRYPTATFELVSPISLPSTAGNGQTFHVSATGQLMIHGVTQTVTIPIDARLNGSQIELAGSITFPFSRFGMTPPSIGGFVTVQDNATMEFQLVLTQQAR
jgi:polyisoprenoid-binding protein YceI